MQPDRLPAAFDPANAPSGKGSVPEYEELQRGEEPPPSVETLEQRSPGVGQTARELHVPHPGDRPGALRVGGSPEPETEDPRDGGEAAADAGNGAAA